MSKAILFIVDDEPNDLRNLREALGARYGSEYDVRTAATAEDARAALKTLAETGVSVALVIASRALSDCDAIGFLNEAQKIHSGAKRIMMAHYLDPGAFIAIATEMRSGRIDYFIHKPWEPCANRLYPIVDDLLAGFRTSRQERGFEVIRIVGRQWEPSSHKLRDLLDRSTVPHGFYDSESEEGRKILSEAELDGSRLPVLFFKYGAVLVQPTMEQIVETLGAKTRPEPGLYDVAIVGGGPAGLAAGVYAASEGLRTVILERETIGGQAGTSSNIENYLGFPRGVSGKELARRAFEQLWRFGASIVFTKSATGLRAENGHRVVTLSGGIEVQSRTVIISTGVAYRRLDVPSLEQFLSVGVFYGAPMCEAQTFAGKEVMIVGAGNSAGQAAVHLARFAARVTLVVRGTSLAASMSDYLVHKLTALPNVEVRLGTRVVEGHGARRLEAVTVERADGERETLRAAGLFVLAGGVPHTQWLPETVARNAQGYILTGRDLLRSGRLHAGWPLERQPHFLETSVPGVFAAGDVRCSATKRVASAVGEGATAIQLVHEYMRSE
jgi:thioredoxin reductase (NADPH)